MDSNILKLMLVTNRNNMDYDEYIKFLKPCIENGISSLQIREKNVSFLSFLKFARKVQEITKLNSVPLIINDNIKLAKKINADGVHIGQSDMDPAIAREELGDDKIIGLSVGSLYDVDCANKLDINYISASAVFPTENKQDVKKFWGLNGLKKVVKVSRHSVIGIGGINAENCSKIIKCGALGCAVIAGIHDAIDPILEIEKFNKAINFCSS